MICCLQSKGTRISLRKQDDFVGFRSIRSLTREIATRAYQEQEIVKLEVGVFNALAKKTRGKTVTSKKKINIYSEIMGLVSIFRKNQISSLAKIQPISVNWWGNIGTV